MNEIILIKNGEIALKGRNRGNFEDSLIKNCKRRLRKVGNFKFSKAQSTIYVTPAGGDIDLDEAMDCLSTVYGIAALCRNHLGKGVKGASVGQGFPCHFLTWKRWRGMGL